MEPIQDLNFKPAEMIINTRMYSSMVRTVRSLTISRSIREGRSAKSPGCRPLVADPPWMQTPWPCDL